MSDKALFHNREHRASDPAPYGSDKSLFRNREHRESDPASYGVYMKGKNKVGDSPSVGRHLTREYSQRKTPPPSHAWWLDDFMQVQDIFKVKSMAHFRFVIARFIDSVPIQLTILALVFLDSIISFMIYIDPNDYSPGSTVGDGLYVLDLTLLFIFAFEILVKLLSFGLTAFMKDGVNIFDFSIIFSFIIIDLCLVTTKTLAAVVILLRILRFVRIFVKVQSYVKIIKRRLHEKKFARGSPMEKALNVLTKLQQSALESQPAAVNQTESETQIVLENSTASNLEFCINAIKSRTLYSNTNHLNRRNVDDYKVKMTPMELLCMKIQSKTASPAALLFVAIFQLIWVISGQLTGFDMYPFTMLTFMSMMTQAVMMFIITIAQKTSSEEDARMASVDHHRLSVLLNHQDFQEALYVTILSKMRASKLTEFRQRIAEIGEHTTKQM